MTTLDMFERPPRAKPQKLMHVWRIDDVSCGAVEAAYKPTVRFMCSKCNHVTDWLDCYTVTEVKRGIACQHAQVLLDHTTQAMTDRVYRRKPVSVMPGKKRLIN